MIAELHGLAKFYRASRLPNGAVSLINRLTRAIIPMPQAAQVVVPALGGVRVLINNPDDLIQNQIYWRGFFEYRESMLMLKTLRKGNTVLDIGANIGWHTLLAASVIGSKGRVIAFEPVEKTFQHLRKNVELNMFDNVTLMKHGLADEKRVADVFAPQANNAGANSLYDPGSSSQPIERISLLKGSEALKDLGVQHVDFCKIDVEGAEIIVLEGLRELLTARCIDVILIELNAAALKRAGSSAIELIGTLTSHGFNIRDVRTGQLVSVGRLPTETNLLCTLTK